MITEDELVMLGELSRHPAWIGLKKIAADRKKMEFDRLSSRLMRGEEVTPADVAYLRGYNEGLRHLFSEVTRAERVRSEVSDRSMG